MRRAIYYDMLRFQPENLQELSRLFDVIRLESPRDDTSEILRDIDVVFAPMGYYLGREKIDLAPALKIIASNTTGTPHIDVDYASAQGIRVISLKDQSEFLSSITPTAELAWGLIFAITRRIPWAFQAVCQGAWNRRDFGASAMLSRMTLGIVGFGRLGSMMADRGLAFGMKVQYYDIRPKQSAASVLRASSLEELVSTSDIVTLHVPLDATTTNLIDGKIVAMFKSAAYLINTSRGEVVDSSALLEALRTGRLAGAATDVLAGEFDPEFAGRADRHPLVEYAAGHQNLVITPHIGGSTRDAWRETEAFTIGLVVKALAGLKPAGEASRQGDIH